MKKIAKIIGKSFLTIILLLGFLTSGGQNIVTLQPDQTSLVIGATVTFPIYVTSTLNQAVFYVSYNKEVLTPFTTGFISDLYTGFTITGNNPFFNDSTSFVSVEEPNFNMIPLNGTVELLKLNFTYKGGTTVMHLRKSPDLPSNHRCKLLDDNGSQITPVTYIDATMGGIVSVYSISGGGSWNDVNIWKLQNDNPGVIPHSGLNAFITGDPVIINSTARAKALTVNAAGHLTLNSGISLTTTGGFTIESGGSFIDNNTGSSITANVKRDLPGNWNPGVTSYQSHLISSPVASQSNSIFAGSLMNKWNEVTPNWDPLTLPYINMAVGVGYALSPLNPGYTSTFSGVMNTGDKTVGVTKTGSGTYSGYNLVGNPYPSPINWNSSVGLDNVGVTAWVWNNAGNYIASNQGNGAVIASLQGFFVQASAAGSVTFTNAARTHNAATFYKSAVNDLLTLRVDGNNYWDQTQVSVNPEATAAFDVNYDARKFGEDIGQPQIYSLIPSETLSINTLPDLNWSSVIQLGFKAGTAGNFVMTAFDLESFPSSTQFYLEDLVANKVQNLKMNQVYNFSGEPGQPEHRFNLHFAPVGMNEGKTASGIRIYSSEKTVYVNVSKELKGNIIVYNMLGSEITRAAIQSLAINKISLDVPSGFYLVKVDGDSSSSAEKVFIR